MIFLVQLKWHYVTGSCDSSLRVIVTESHNQYTWEVFMFMRKRMVLVCAAIGLALSASQVMAVYLTGQVGLNVLVSLADGESVIVVNVTEDGVPKTCFAVSNDTSNKKVTNATIAGFATILAAKKITGIDASINCDDVNNELVSVQ